MHKRRTDGLILLLLGTIAFLAIGIVWSSRAVLIAGGDFKVVYYSARCLLQHGDPYSEKDVLTVYQGEGRESPEQTITSRQVMTRYFYPPTAFIVTLPFAFLGFGIGHILWIAISAGTLILGAILMWDVGSEFAPVLSGFLLGFLLMNSFWLFMMGNSSAIVVGLCVIAVWCFLRNRLVSVGVVCLALSLALKPNDSGLVWLFFLLAGGVYRKRALHTLAVLLILGVGPILWVTHQSPHWPHQMRANMSSFSGIGGITDPTATGKAGRYMDSVVELQSAVSILWPEPQAYNSITYLICGALLLIWAMASFRLKSSPRPAWLILAATAPLTMMPTYHMQHDAKLLMLAVPACALVWAERGAIGWAALLITSAGLVTNGDIFTAVRISLTRRFLVPQPSLPSELLTIILTRPGPLALLVMSGFYLWISLRRPVTNSAPLGPENTETNPAEPAPARA